MDAWLTAQEKKLLAANKALRDEAKARIEKALTACDSWEYDWNNFSWESEFQKEPIKLHEIAWLLPRVRKVNTGSSGFARRFLRDIPTDPTTLSLRQVNCAARLGYQYRRQIFLAYFSKKILSAWRPDDYLTELRRVAAQAATFAAKHAPPPAAGPLPFGYTVRKLIKG